MPIPLNLYHPERGDVSFQDAPEPMRDRAGRLLRAGGAAAGRGASLAVLAALTWLWRLLLLPLLLLLAASVGLVVIFVAHGRFLDALSALICGGIVAVVMWCLHAAAARYALYTMHRIIVL